jgi:hypothetical protein
MKQVPGIIFLPPYEILISHYLYRKISSRHIIRSIAQYFKDLSNVMGLDSNITQILKDYPIPPQCDRLFFFSQEIPISEHWKKKGKKLNIKDAKMRILGTKTSYQHHSTPWIMTVLEANEATLVEDTPRRLRSRINVCFYFLYIYISYLRFIISF